MSIWSFLYNHMHAPIIMPLWWLPLTMPLHSYPYDHDHGHASMNIPYNHAPMIISLMPLWSCSYVYDPLNMFIWSCPKDHPYDCVPYYLVSLTPCTMPLWSCPKDHPIWLCPLLPCPYTMPLWSCPKDHPPMIVFLITLPFHHAPMIMSQRPPPMIVSLITLPFHHAPMIMSQRPSPYLYIHTINLISCCTFIEIK